MKKTFVLLLLFLFAGSVSASLPPERQTQPQPQTQEYRRVENVRKQIRIQELNGQTRTPVRIQERQRLQQHNDQTHIQDRIARHRWSSYQQSLRKDVQGRTQEQAWERLQQEVQECINASRCDWKAVEIEQGLSMPEIPETYRAVKRMYDNWLTSYSTPDTFLPSSLVTREQAAKFFSVFATAILWKTEDDSLPCNFSDIGQATPDLVDDIISSCRLGIFKWYQGHFNPKANITMTDTQVVLIRTIVWMLPENWAHYADSYHQKGYDMWLFDGRTRGVTPQDRWGIAIYMFEYKFLEYRNHQNSDCSIKDSSGNCVNPGSDYSNM